MANATASAIGRNRNSPRPGIRASGASTSSVQRLATSSGIATSLAPRNAASSGRGAQAQVPVRVLQADDRAIDHRPDRQRQPGQRHDVDRVARGVQADQRRQDRDRDRQHGDRRHPPLAQEEQDHQRAQHRPQHALPRPGSRSTAARRPTGPSPPSGRCPAGVSRGFMSPIGVLERCRPPPACWPRAGGRPGCTPVAGR